MRSSRSCFGFPPSIPRTCAAGPSRCSERRGRREAAGDRRDRLPDVTADDGRYRRYRAPVSPPGRDGPRVVCGGGASLAAIVKRATGWGLSGIEFGSAIPGTAGGAVRMNAGAYGGEVRDILEEAVVVGPAGDRRGGPDALWMTYRRSNVAAGEVVAEAVLRPTPADPARIRTTVSD